MRKNGASERIVRGKGIELPEWIYKYHLWQAGLNGRRLLIRMILLIFRLPVTPVIQSRNLFR